MKKNILRFILATTPFIIFLAWLYILPYILLFFSPFSWAEADINQNGYVTPTEADYYGNYGTNTFTENNQECVEYYALKDGIPLKKECN